MKTHIPDTTKFNGSKIKDLRILRGLSLEEVATMVECDPSSVSLWERGERRPNVKSLRRLAEFFKVPISVFFIVLLCFMTSPAYAGVSSNDAIQTIVGEASGQGFDGMTAVGEVIRHRGSVKGFYGFAAMNHRKEPAEMWEMARKAWERSASSRLTYDDLTGKWATLFENIKAFGFPKSWDNTKVIAIREIGDHVFFVED